MKGTNGEPVEPEIAYTILRLIVPMLQIRRTITHSVHINGVEI